MKHASAFLLGVFLMLAAYVVAQGTKPASQTSRKAWEMTSVSFDDFNSNKYDDGKIMPIIGEKALEHWIKVDGPRYEKEKARLLLEGWEPFQVGAVTGTFTDGQIVYFRRQK